jgi:uncharacterized protein (UPF0333 family)
MNGSFFGIIIVVVVLALVAGLAVFGNDRVNPNTSAANADAIRQVTQTKTDKEAIAWNNAQQQGALEWDKAQQEAAFQQRQSDQTLAFTAQRNQYELAQMQQRDQIVNSLLPPTLVAAILLATLFLSAAIAYYLIQPGRSEWIAQTQAQAKAQAQALVAVQSPAQTQAAQIESWNDLNWRTERIREARAHEATERWVELARLAA